MDEETRKLQEKRNKLFSDFYNNIVPERMPVAFSLHNSIAAEYSGLNMDEVNFDYSLMSDAAQKIMKMVYSDTSMFRGAGFMARLPGCYQAIDSKTFILGTAPVMQHPEVEGMKREDYDYLIEDPYACLLERVLPAQHTALAPDNGIMRSIALAKMNLEDQREGRLARNGYAAKIMDEGGYYVGAPWMGLGFSACPFDFIGDQLRGFSNIVVDVRRDREKIKAACEAVLPIVFTYGLPPMPHPEGSVGMPLHMAPYMRLKDFEELWFPTFLIQARQYAARGARLSPFAEEDWMRYIDYLAEFPAGTVVKYEKGDPKLIKEKLGDKLLATGLYPLILLRTGTKEQVIDKAKEILDVMLPGCGYIMDFDKSPLSIGDINWENLCALTEFVRDYAKYDNPGEHFGTPLNSEHFEIDKSIEKVESKYFTNWKEYKEKYPHTPEFYKDVLHEFDMEIMKSYIALLL